MKRCTALKTVWFIGLLLFPFCSVPVSGPGTGSETTNGVVATIQYQNGLPASNIQVKIRPYDFLTDTTGKIHPFIDTTTDSSGRIVLDEMRDGIYTVDIIDHERNEGVVFNCKVDNNSIENAGVIFLDRLSGIDGHVDADSQGITGYVQVYGLERLAAIDPNTGAFHIDSLPQGNYSVRILPSQSSYMPEIITGITVRSEEKTVIDSISVGYRSLWPHSRQIFLNTTGSGANVAVDIYKFPLLVRLNSENFDFSAAESSGEDVRFIKADGSPLVHHIERWDNVNKMAELWIKIDTVYGNNDAQYFSMLWGNPDAPGQNNSSSAVFDTTIGFNGVWHMDQGPDGKIADATGNHLNATCVAMPLDSQLQGIIGQAQSFNGSSSYAFIPNSSAGKLNYSQNGKFTISAWVKTEVLDSAFHVIVSKGNYQYGLQINPSNRFEIYKFRDKTGWWFTDAPAVSSAWKYVTGVCDGNRQSLYIDGVLVNSVPVLNASKSLSVTTNNVCFGMRSGDSHRNFYGAIDEIRMSSWANSAHWIKLSYMNQRIDDKLVFYK